MHYIVQEVGLPRLVSSHFVFQCFQTVSGAHPQQTVQNITTAIVRHTTSQFARPTRDIDDFRKQINFVRFNKGVTDAIRSSIPVSACSPRLYKPKHSMHYTTLDKKPMHDHLSFHGALKAPPYSACDEAYTRRSISFSAWLDFCAIYSALCVA